MTRDYNETILKDIILDFYQGKIVIKDNIFELELNDGGIIIGDLSIDISNEYKEVYSNDFFGTIGKSLIYNKEVDKAYTSYRLIEMII